MAVGNVEVGIVSYSKAIIPADPSRAYTRDCLRCLKSCLKRCISLFENPATASALPIKSKPHCPASPRLPTCFSQKVDPTLHAFSQFLRLHSPDISTNSHGKCRTLLFKSCLSSIPAAPSNLPGNPHNSFRLLD
jgi:hypothetical protein